MLGNQLTAVAASMTLLSRDELARVVDGEEDRVHAQGMLMVTACCARRSAAPAPAARSRDTRRYGVQCSTEACAEALTETLGRLRRRLAR